MLIFALIGLTALNSWIWRITAFNILLSIILILSTIFLFKKWKTLFLVTFVILLYFQLLTTAPQSLILLDNDEQRIKSERLQFYNPSIHYVRVIFARFNLKEFLEGDFNIALTRVARNFFETIDPNIYFFGGHPRERVWVNDFEKFPFIFIIPFLMGLYQVFKKNEEVFMVFFIASIIISSGLGHKNSLGPFIFFPFFIILIFNGLIRIIKFFKIDENAVT